MRLSKPLIEKIAEQVALGVPFKYAAATQGVAESTFQLWMAIGLGKSVGRRVSATLKRQCEEFVEAIKKAQSKAVSRNIGIINVAAQQSWQAAAWWLERQFPHEFGRSDRVHMDARVGVVDLSKTTQATREIIEKFGLLEFDARVAE
ncbi:MAG: hypothetical protein ONA90_01270 [candidate division KSB1 bacterium]|nr:hypothetical protein [candidate division KSB1 bacterium]